MYAWLALPLLLTSTTIQVAPNGEVPAAASVGSLPAGVDTALVPTDPLDFTTLDQRMTVPVTIGEGGPYRFIIDTGAERTVIARELAMRLKLAAGRTIRLTAMTGTSIEPTAVIPALSVGPLAGQRIEAPALAATHLGAAGMIGIDVLQGHAVTIDFDAQTMAVSRASKRRAAERADPDEVVVRARSLFGQLVVTDAFYGDQRVRVVLDTGSPVSIGNPALMKRLGKRALGMPLVQLTSVTGGVLTAPYTSIDRIKLGGLSISNLPIAFSDAPPFKRFGLEKKPAILLGMDALGLFRRVDIDFANRVLRLRVPRELREGRV